MTGCKCIHQFVGPLQMQRLVLPVTPREKTYTLSNEFRNFKTVCYMRVGASVCECGTPLRDSLDRVRTDGAFNKSTEGFWPGRLRSGGSCLHSHRQ